MNFKVLENGRGFGNSEVCSVDASKPVFSPRSDSRDAGEVLQTSENQSYDQVQCVSCMSRREPVSLDSGNQRHGLYVFCASSKRSRKECFVAAAW
jgi:hypothetical protein